MEEIDWQDEKTHFILNPRLSAQDLMAFERARRLLPEVKGHVWLSSSGTTQASSFKLIALSKRAFLCGAEASNRHLESGSFDTWLCALPRFHVGGLAIFARAHLSGARLVDVPDRKWDVKHFLTILQDEKVTLTSLVATQVFDLVRDQVLAPERLRAVIVGGGALPERFYLEARKLGWNLLPSYGLTECCSQVATARLSSLKERTFPSLKVLDHVQARITDSGQIELSSKALFTGQALVENGGFEYSDPKNEGWFVTNDIGKLSGVGQNGEQDLQVLGRTDDLIKIYGELVSLTRLSEILHDALWTEGGQGEGVLLATPDDRAGKRIDLVFRGVHLSRAQEIKRRFNQRVAPYERINKIYFVAQIPKTELGKVKRKELLSQLGF